MAHKRVNCPTEKTLITHVYENYKFKKVQTLQIAAYLQYKVSCASYLHMLSLLNNMSFRLTLVLIWLRVRRHLIKLLVRVRTLLRSQT